MPEEIVYARRARSGGLVAGLLLLAAFPAVGCDGDAGDDSASPGAGQGGTGGAGAASGKGGGGSSAGTAGSPSGGAGSGAGGSPAAVAMAACKAFCAAEEDCNPDTTLADCERVECVNPVNPSQALAESPPDCQQALTGYWTCLAMASDPCNRDSCPTDDVASACF